MGKFSGYVICSDVDFTLCMGTDICDENIKAIEYFQQNGGLFTLCTGRNLDYINRNFSDKFRCNTYVITLNGTSIVDTGDGSVVWDRQLDADVCKRIIDCVHEYKDSVIRVTLCTQDRLENYEGGDIYSSNKVVTVSYTPQQLKKIRNALESINDGSFSLNQSWDTGLEAIPADSGKGTCIRELKKLLGSSVHTVIAVGDNENDLTMLEAADVSYAVEDAIERARQLADRITRKCMEGSIAAIVEDIEKGEI